MSKNLELKHLERVARAATAAFQRAFARHDRAKKKLEAAKIELRASAIALEAATNASDRADYELDSARMYQLDESYVAYSRAAE